jgi:hypothetical protein
MSLNAADTLFMIVPPKKAISPLFRKNLWPGQYGDQVTVGRWA